MTTLHGRRRVRGRGERPSQSHTEGTSDNVLGGVGAGPGAQGGELVPVPQEAPVVLARVHDEPAEEPAPRLPTQGLLGFPLGDVVADVDQLDEEDVRHACRDDHGVPHAGEGQGGAGGTKGGSAPRSLPSQSRHHPNIPHRLITEDLVPPQLPHLEILFYPHTWDYPRVLWVAVTPAASSPGMLCENSRGISAVCVPHATNTVPDITALKIHQMNEQFLHCS